MTTVPTPEPEGYAVTAAELRRIADALDTLPPGDEPPFVLLSILPEHTTEAVDAVALAVLGKPGQPEGSGGNWHHLARGEVGKSRVHLCVQTSIPAPPDERDAEIERLRSELAEARVRAMPVPNVDQTPTRHMRAGFGYSREADDPVPGAVPGGVDGHSEFSGRASVPDMQTRPTCTCPLGPEDAHFPDCPMAQGAELVTRYFSFGHGQTDPDTGESLLDKYATVIAPTVEACRAAMFASRYGNRWSFDYAPDDPKWIEWGPQWTEHDRIVVGPAPDPYCGGE